MQSNTKCLCNNYIKVKPLEVIPPKFQDLTLEALISKFNSHLLSLYVFYKSSNEKLLKYQLIVSCVIIALILITNLL